MSSYYGRNLDNISNVEKLDNITFNGGTTYALTKSSAAFTPAGANNILISIDGVVQQGNFSVSGSNIVFTFSPTSSNTCDFIMHYGTGLVSIPADDTVSTAKIQNDAVTVDKLNLISTSSVPSLEAKGTSGVTEGYIQLNCAENSHGIKLKSPPHSAGQSYTLTFPSTAPASNKIMQTDGSGNLSFVDSPSGTLVPLYHNSSSSISANVILDNYFSSTYQFYRLQGAFINDTDNGNLLMRYRTGGASGSTYSGAEYHHTLSTLYTNSSDTVSRDDTGNFSDDAFVLTFNQNIDSDSDIAYVVMDFYDVNTNIMGRPLVQWSVQWTGNSAGRTYTAHGAGRLGTNNSPTGILFTYNNGSVQKHHLSLYGVKNS